MGIFSKDPPYAFTDVQDPKIYDWDEIISLVDRVADLEKKVLKLSEAVTKIGSLPGEF